MEILDDILYEVRGELNGCIHIKYGTVMSTFSAQNSDAATSIARMSLMDFHAALLTAIQVIRSTSQSQVLHRTELMDPGDNPKSLELCHESRLLFRGVLKASCQTDLGCLTRLPIVASSRSDVFCVP
jgi:hypothetical protein